MGSPIHTLHVNSKMSLAFSEQGKNIPGKATGSHESYGVLEVITLHTSMSPKSPNNPKWNTLDLIKDEQGNALMKRSPCKILRKEWHAIETSRSIGNGASNFLSRLGIAPLELFHSYMALAATRYTNTLDDDRVSYCIPKT